MLVKYNIYRLEEEKEWDDFMRKKEMEYGQEPKEKLSQSLYEEIGTEEVLPDNTYMLEEHYL